MLLWLAQEISRELLKGAWTSGEWSVRAYGDMGPLRSTLATKESSLALPFLAKLIS